MPTCGTCGTSSKAGQLTCLLDGKPLLADDAPADAASIISGDTALASGSAPQGGAPDRLPAGTAVGDYRIEGLVGAGAMGDVYRASHPVINKQVAVKVIQRRHAATGEALERFVREARAVNTIKHPNLVDIFGMGRLPDGRIYLVMDLLEGESLAAKLRRDGPLHAHDLIDVLRPICEALTAAHAHGIVHRDLKPDNVFLQNTTGRPHVKLLDFGIAKVVAEETESRGLSEKPGQALTVEGAWVGTPVYMAPEQWVSEPVTPQTDVYALGVMAYELLAGRPPYRGSTYSQLMEQHFRGVPPPLSETGDGEIPPGLADAIASAMAKRPEDRPAGAHAFLERIEAAVGQGGHAVATAGAAAPIGDHQRRRPAAPWLIGGAVAVLAAAAVIAFVVSRMQKKDGQARAAAGAAAGDRVASERATVHITSEPDHAEVRMGGTVLGLTPLHAALDRGAAELTASRPGFRNKVLRIRVDQGEQTQHFSLDPMESFKGYWKTSNGLNRYFEREGDRVAGYSADVKTGERSFLRVFEFRPSDTDATFVATLDHIDREHANEPSCHIPLSAEYRYTENPEKLELRLEKAEYHFNGRVCVKDGKGAWEDWQTAERFTPEAFRTTVVISNAGSGNPSLADPPNLPQVANTDLKGPTTKQAPRKQVSDPKLKKMLDTSNQKDVAPKPQAPLPQQTKAAPKSKLPAPQNAVGSKSSGDKQLANPPANEPGQQQGSAKGD